MQKVLIANRGEIAVRIIRACHDLDLETVAIFSEADKEALHVLHADEAVCVGEGPSNKSYLKVPNILSACEITGADAIHPGYGYLSENAEFASICETCGITFIGPTSDAITLLGNKAEAKATAKRAGCPVIPGSDGPVSDQAEEALEVAKSFGFPVLIKAVAGGGGKGIRFVYKEEDFVKLFIEARREAEISFGNPDIYLEKMILDPRHVEVQVMGDQHGNVVHLGERDCTIQRRRQKLIEESPSGRLDDKLRARMGEAACAIAKEAGYFSAGTVEFLLDQENNFYFMEMNTRIQVEHTVTEEWTQQDLVQEQLKIAMGEKLSFSQKDVQFHGHVMEFRINAEDPAKGFSPSPGKLDYYLPPGGPHVRVDSSCYSGYSIPPYYDSMIAKLIVKGSSRQEAIAIAKRALKEFHIGGVASTVAFHQFILEDENFLSGDYDLNYIDGKLNQGCTFTLKEETKG